MLNIPNKKIWQRVKFGEFKGIDLSNEPSSVNFWRSPDCLNMISDLTKKPVKRFGYKTIIQNVGRVWGLHSLITKTGEEKKLIHGDNKLYLWHEDNSVELLYTGCNEKKSVSFLMSGTYQEEDADYKQRLWFLDGKTFLVYDGDKIVTVESIAYVPTTTIHRTPKGGGESQDDVNYLCDKRINTFVCTATDISFQLDATSVTDVTKCEKMDASGNWVKVDGYSLNAKTGVVTFLAGIGEPTVTGVDNLRITYSKKVEDYKDTINKCDIATLFSINNFCVAFVTGNSNYPNRDFHCYNEKPNYFPDKGYSIVGQGNSCIMGYHKVTDYQAIIKEEKGNDATMYLRNGELNITENKATMIFPLKQGVCGNGAISKHGFISIGSDHMFLSKDGVVALSNNAISKERATINRSEFINRALVNETDMQNTVAIEHRGYGYFALNGKVYVCDGMQPKANVNNDEYSYEWFLWDNIDVDCFFTCGNKLYFGNKEGVNMFHTTKRTSSYNDNGKAINAHWDTPVTDLADYSKYKKVNNIYTTLMPFSRSGVKIYMKIGGKWKLIENKHLDLLFFDDFDFRRFSFNCNSENSVIATKKIKEKGIVLTQLRFENNQLESFGVVSSIIEFLFKKEL